MITCILMTLKVYSFGTKEFYLIQVRNKTQFSGE